jgi:hypothetical protein
MGPLTTSISSSRVILMPVMMHAVMLPVAAAVWGGRHGDDVITPPGLLPRAFTSASHPPVPLLRMEESSSRVQHLQNVPRRPTDGRRNQSLP